MKILTKDKVVCYDVDNTLVMHPKTISKDSKLFRGTYTDSAQYIEVVCPDTEIVHKLVPNQDHIMLLKKHFKRDFTVLVWSHAGHRWAARVIQALCLEDYVDVVMEKPHLYVDDKTVTAWGWINLYLKNGYGS